MSGKFRSNLGQIVPKLTNLPCQIKFRPDDEEEEIERVRVRQTHTHHTHSPARRGSRVIVRESRQSIHIPSTTYTVPTPAPLAIPAPQPVPVFVAPQPPSPPPPRPPPSPRHIHVVEVGPSESVSSRSSHDDYVYERRREVRRDYSPARSERSERYEYRYLDAPEREERAHFSRRRDSRSRSRSRSAVRHEDDGYRTTRERVVYHVDRNGNRDSRYHD